MINVSISDSFVEEGLAFNNTSRRSVDDNNVTAAGPPDTDNRSRLAGCVIGESILAMQWPRESLVLAHVVERMMLETHQFSDELTRLENAMASAAADIVEFWQNLDNRSS